MSFPRSLLLFLLVALALLTGCVEDPSTVGLGILPTGDLPVFQVDTVWAVAGATSRTIPLTARPDPELTIWSPQHLFVGGVNTLVSGSFIRFEQFPNSMTGVSIDAADLLLVRTTAVGDSTLTPALTLHRPLRRWGGDSLSYDSLQMSGVYFDNAPLPPGVGTGLADTVDRSIILPLDTALVRQWFTTVVDSGESNLGIFLRGSANGVIQGYGSFLHASPSARPRLRINYRKDGVAGTAVYSAGTSRYLADLPPGDLVLDPGKVYVQSGVAYRGRITFDLSSIPRPVSVSNAIVQVTLDSAASSAAPSPDSLLAIFVDSDGSVLTSTAEVSERWNDGGNAVFSFRLPSFAQQWLQSATPATVALAAFRENSNFDRFVLYGAGAAIGVRPRLILTYSKAIATYGGRR